MEEHGGAWGLDLPVSHDVERPLEASAGVWEALGFQAILKPFKGSYKHLGGHCKTFQL